MHNKIGVILGAVMLVVAGVVFTQNANPITGLRGQLVTSSSSQRSYGDPCMEDSECETGYCNRTSAYGGICGYPSSSSSSSTSPDTVWVLSCTGNMEGSCASSLGMMEWFEPTDPVFSDEGTCLANISSFCMGSSEPSSSSACSGMGEACSADSDCCFAPLAVCTDSTCQDAYASSSSSCAGSGDACSMNGDCCNWPSDLCIDSTCTASSFSSVEVSSASSW